MFQRCRSVIGFVSTTVVVFIFLCGGALTAHALVNINTASIDLLDTLPGVGPVTAQYIIDGRPYASASEISSVKGIGEPGSKTYEDIMGLITVDGGESAVPEETPEPEPVSQEGGSSTPPSASSGGVFIEDTLAITVDAGSDRTVFVGADSTFEARVIGAKGLPIENARVVWSFGNGDHKEGDAVRYHFLFPGTYIVTADAANDVYSATDRIEVTVVPARVAVTEVTGEYIALKNNSDVELDLGGWLLFSLGRQFQFPQHTIIVPGQEVLVSNKRTGLSGADPSTVALQYPNGIVAAQYEYPLFVARTGSAPRQAPAAAPEAATLKTPEEALVSSANLITSPAAASSGTSSIWMWLASIVILSGLSGIGLAYMRKKRYNQYDIEEL